METTPTRTSRGWVALVGLLAVFATVVAACGGGSGSSSTANTGGAKAEPNVTIAASGPPKAGGSLTYALEAETDGFNPSVNRWAISGFMVANAVFDPLVAYDSNYTPQPYLAKSLTPSADFKTWTIVMRDGIKFSNGQPLDGAAVKTDMDAVRKSPLTGAAVANITDIQVDPSNPQAIVVTMAQPWASFPVTLTGQIGFIAAPAQIQATGEAATRQPIGTGPFIQSQWIPDNKWVGTKNPNYWRKDANGNQLPYLDSVTFKPIPDNQNRLNALNTGDVQMMQTSNWGPIATLRSEAASGQIQLAEDPGNDGTSFIMFNTTKAPVNDLRVRQAIAYCTDKNQIAQVGQIPADSLRTSQFAPDSPFYVDTNFPTYDPQKGTDLINQVKASTGGDVSFTIGTTPVPENTAITQVLAQQWQACGMKVQTAAIEQSKFISDAVTGNYQVNLWRQFSAADPDGDYVWWIGKNATGPLALNMARLQDSQIDQALNDARGTNDVAARKKDYATLQERQTALLPYIWISKVLWVVGASNSVRNITNVSLPDGQQSAPFDAGAQRLTQTWLQQ